MIKIILEVKSGICGACAQGLPNIFRILGHMPKNYLSFRLYRNVN